MPQLPTGLVPIIATPFTEAGELDVASLRRLVEFQLHCGVDGIAVFGMAGEGFTLTTGERREVLRAVTEVADGQVPVVAGVSATSLVTAKEQAHDAVASGAAALMVLPPHLVKPTPTQLVEFYAGLAAVSNVEILVQDAPGVTGVALATSLIAELSKLEGVTAVKVESPPTPVKTGEVCGQVAPGFRVLGGQNAVFVLEELSRGATGTMPACEFADQLRVVLDEWMAGNVAAARTAFDRLLPLIRFGMQPGLAWAVHKQVLARRGVISSPAVRLPAQALDRTSMEDLRAILNSLALPAWPALRRGGG